MSRLIPIGLAFIAGLLIGWISGHYAGFCEAFDDKQNRLKGKP